MQQRRTDAQMQVLKSLILRALEQPQPAERGQTIFLVRDRVVIARKEPRAGAAVVGSLVPHQTAVLLDAEGKWVRVDYFDWHTQKARQGWVLKKYLLRASRRRNRRLTQLTKARERVSAAGIAPLTMDEINAEIKADRAESGGRNSN